jgi:CRISPR/Cas system-associated exonuclease Cas4 (RecB family)
MPDQDAIDTYIDRIGADSFSEWYREREWARNIWEGQPYFNGPSSVPPVEKHTPSSLLQCHRKILYRQENAPAEQADPEGIFWTGTRFEEDVVVPYLRDTVVDDDTYVRNSMWIDCHVDSPAGMIRFRGSADPCIVDRFSEPLLVTEVKTKQSVDGIDSPNRHHRAQVHAYMRGLSEEYDQDVDEAVIIYGGREQLNVRAFREPFDPDFWAEVVDWAATHTEYRQEEELPPADPEYGWECKYCSYKHRCGQSDEPYADLGARGFLPLFADYPREQVVEYLEAHDDAALTPTLARTYPGLAEAYPVADWTCPRCEQTVAWDHVTWDGDPSSPPLCEECVADGELVTLQEPHLDE